MSKENNDILLFGIGGISLYLIGRYIKVYNIIKKLSFIFNSFSFDRINNGGITLSFYINVTNPTNERLEVKGSSLKCYLNSIYAGNVYIPYTQIVNPNSTTQICVATTIYYKTAFSEWWNSFIQMTTTVHLTIAGSLRFSGVFVPIPQIKVAEFNLQDSITKILQ